MSLYKKHVFVCVTGKTCAKNGSEKVHSTLKELVSEAGLKKSIRINKSGCLDQCDDGPVVVVYPDGAWYTNVHHSDCEELFQSDLIENKPVKRLLYCPDKD